MTQQLNGNNVTYSIETDFIEHYVTCNNNINSIENNSIEQLYITLRKNPILQDISHYSVLICIIHNNSINGCTVTYISTWQMCSFDGVNGNWVMVGQYCH